MRISKLLHHANITYKGVCFERLQIRPHRAYSKTRNGKHNRAAYPGVLDTSNNRTVNKYEKRQNGQSLIHGIPSTLYYISNV